MPNNEKFLSKRPKSNLMKISDVLETIKETLGINKQLKLNALREIWPLITSFDVANESNPAYFDKENNLVISCKNGVLATELSMQKLSIIDKLKKAIKNTNITFNDIRFIHRHN